MRDFDNSRAPLVNGDRGVSPGCFILFLAAVILFVVGCSKLIEVIGNFLMEYRL